MRMLIFVWAVEYFQCALSLQRKNSNVGFMRAATTRSWMRSPSASTCFGTANSGTLPAAPGPQDICPMVYAGNSPFNPMHGGNSNIGPPPPLTGSAAGPIGTIPGQLCPPQPDSRGPDSLPGPVCKVSALSVRAPTQWLPGVPSIPCTSNTPTQQALWLWVEQPAHGHGSRSTCPIISSPLSSSITLGVLCTNNLAIN
ncbi:hypothetical protein FS749_015669 [Ceratobasidium sp. UAMH 11750]|nr:hypothetical protein FS749_015669 [Ceratobasidium sp. UAMH 11750]